MKVNPVLDKNLGQTVEKGSDKPSDRCSSSKKRGRKSSLTAADSGASVGIIIAFLLLLLCLLALAVYGWSEIRLSDNTTRQNAKASRLLMFSQRYAREANAAIQGDVEAYTSFEESKEEINQLLETLNLGDSTVGLRPLSLAANELLRNAAAKWEPLESSGQQLLESRPDLVNVNTWAAKIEQLAPLLLSQSDEVVESLAVERAAADLINIAGRQRSLVQRIRASIAQLQLGREGAAASSTQYGRDARLFDQTLRMLQERGSASVRSKLGEVDQTFAEFKSTLAKMLENEPGYFTGLTAVESISAQSADFTQSVEALIGQINNERFKEYQKWAPWVLGLLLFGALFFLIRSITKESRRRAASVMAEFQGTRVAIDELHQNIEEVGRGDLSTKADTEHKVVGETARSFNRIVDDARYMVGDIRRGTGESMEITNAMTASSESLGADAAAQMRYINLVMEEIQKRRDSMSSLTAEVDSTASASRHAFEVARRGTDAVRQTIRGVDTMRDQIQETAKRIKRMQSNSDLINGITRQVNELADQTNVLALNAAIQAASAGEAGRGFAVVADEVQRLAERSTKATQQLTDMIETIHTDTHGAMTYMESASREAVESSLLADNAGKAITEVEAVAEQFIQSIDKMAAQASTQTGNVSVMQDSLSEVLSTAEKTGLDVRELQRLCENQKRIATDVESAVAKYRLEDEKPDETKYAETELDIDLGNLEH